MKTKEILASLFALSAVCALLFVYVNVAHADHITACAIYHPSNNDAYAVGNSSNPQMSQPFTVSEPCLLSSIGTGIYVAAGDPSLLSIGVWQGAGDTLLAECTINPAAGFGEWATTTMTGLDSCNTDVLLEPETQYYLTFGNNNDDENYFGWPYNDESSYGLPLDQNWTSGSFFQSVFFEIDGSVAGDEEAPAADVTTGTSTLDQTQRNIWNGYWSFFAMMVFVVWLIRQKK